ncbi:MAG: NCLDV major capsid protein [Barrevirus sp.]|uniref:NCLDV major capsid protein n=1 Tax=Barrevirus sp. TaxID=2487763 RepID=A0A3G4ZV68_9VIRU|nr:MAG: NCLDV major capsid protein [Barrevirus sp.]
MAGGLLQLTSYGPEDIYLTKDPQITFFKTVYRRATNFSIQTFEKTFNDNPDFGKRGSVKVYRLGDLATKMYLRIIINKISVLPGTKFSWVKRLGHALIRSIEIKIGGSTIDKHYGQWLDIWYELCRQGNHERGYKAMIGDIEELTEYNDKDKDEYVLYVPLQFWFNRNYGLALPLIAIQYHDVFINVEFEEKEKLIVHSDTFFDYDQVKILEVGLITDYIYLDLEERERFAISGHEYLIEKLQFYGDEVMDQDYKRLLLDFNYPTKELIWVIRNGQYCIGEKFLFYSGQDDWTKDIKKFSKEVLINSCLLLGPDEQVPDYGIWEEFGPGSINYQSYNGNLTVTNKSKLSLWINTGSLLIGEYSLTDKIVANIIVNDSNILTIKVVSGLLSKDISKPMNLISDTRLNSGTGVHVYQFSNYGLYITGEKNPVLNAKIEFNDQERVQKRNGKFFGTLQPYMHHSNTPKTGINLYSFAFDPECHQPSGCTNFSNIENAFLSVWQNKEFINQDNKLYIYGVSYNIYRIIAGLTALAY